MVKTIVKIEIEYEDTFSLALYLLGEEREPFPIKEYKIK